MTHGEQERAAGPKWLPWAFLGLLVLPFHPLWIDFEQVRRGLLLALAGAALCALPRLPRPPGNGAGALFIGALVLSGVWTWCAQQSEQDADTPASFAVWEAMYRIAHWYALLVTMRLGALSGAASATACGGGGFLLAEWPASSSPRCVYSVFGCLWLWFLLPPPLAVLLFCSPVVSRLVPPCSVSLLSSGLFLFLGAAA